jgi:hypothetical protein
MALITVEQYGLRVGVDYDAEDSSPSAEQEQIEAFIDDASALVVQIAFSDADNEWETPDDTPAAVIPVVVSMVRRAIENPRGLSGEQLGDYQWQAGQGISSATIYATRREERIIRKAAGLASLGHVQFLTGDESESDDDLLGS